MHNEAASKKWTAVVIEVADIVRLCVVAVGACAGKEFTLSITIPSYSDNASPGTNEWLENRPCPAFGNVDLSKIKAYPRPKPQSGFFVEALVCRNER